MGRKRSFLDFTRDISPIKNANQTISMPQAPSVSKRIKSVSSSKINPIVLYGFFGTSVSSVSKKRINFFGQKLKNEGNSHFEILGLTRGELGSVSKRIKSVSTLQNKLTDLKGFFALSVSSVSKKRIKCKSFKERDKNIYIIIILFFIISLFSFLSLLLSFFSFKSEGSIYKFIELVSNATNKKALQKGG